MEQTTALALVVAAVIGLVAVLAMLRQQRPVTESRFAASTEGSKLCPKCGMGNMWTVANCVSCHAKLPG